MAFRKALVLRAARALYVWRWSRIGVSSMAIENVHLIGVCAMATITTHPRNARLRMQAAEFWSGDTGLTLLTISLVALVFVITPMREAAVSGRMLLDVVVISLMIFGAVSVRQSRIATILVVGFICVTAVILAMARFHSAPALHRWGSVLSTITLLLYFRIVLLVVFEAGPITWNRIQGGVCAYLLLGMAWASAYQVIEQLQPGSFHFVIAPADFDQLISKLTYFSFCTLTTVGGDIAPVSPIARSLTIAEATVGQVFPAILISTLVAMAMQSRTKA
jgi:voltage-gated potassium channel